MLCVTVCRLPCRADMRAAQRHSVGTASRQRRMDNGSIPPIAKTANALGYQVRDRNAGNHQPNQYSSKPFILIITTSHVRGRRLPSHVLTALFVYDALAFLLGLGKLHVKQRSARLKTRAFAERSE